MSAGEFHLGQRVAYSNHLVRRTRHSDGSYFPDTLKVWTTDPVSTPYRGMGQNEGGEGIIIGRRTLANGKNHYLGYDEPIVFKPSEYFPAYLIAYDLRRQPVYVLPEHLTALAAS